MKQLTNKQKIADSFSQAASQYDQVAKLQLRVGEEIIERLEYIKIEPEVILDIGSSTGILTQQLAANYPKSTTYGLDIAFGMTAWSKQKTSLEYICADAEFLPFADNSVDFIYSNFTIQWCEDLSRLFSDIQRVLKPGGLLMFSTVGVDTLQELRESWQQVEDNAHVNQFADMHDIGDALVHSGFADPVMDTAYYTLTYGTVKQLLKDLKVLGSQNVMHQKQRGLIGPNKMQNLARAYEAYKDDAGLLPATYEVIFGHAWGSDKPMQQRGPQGEVYVDIEQLFSSKSSK